MATQTVSGLPGEMRAAVYQERARLAVERRPLPGLGPGDALVEVDRCGICGTDLHMVLEGMALPGSIGGHEWSGRIVALGTGVTGWSIGDRVVAGPIPGCGACPSCRRGRPSVCLKLPLTDFFGFQGAFAEFVRTEATRLVRIPDGLAPRAAALTEPLAVALHAVTVAAPAPGQRVLVTGAGPIGLLTIAALRALGVDDLTVSEPGERRRERASALGVRRTVRPEELPGAPLTTPVDEPFDLAFECSGRATACEAAIDQLGLAGTLVLVGTGSERPRVNHNRVILLELTVTGAYNYDADGFARALELLASGRFPVDLLLEPVDVPLGGMLAAMHGLAAGKLAGKVLVDPRAA